MTRLSRRLVTVACGAVFALGAAAGCGEDEGGTSCEQPGTGSASGELEGWEDEVARVSYGVGEDLEATAYVVSLDTGPGSCALVLRAVADRAALGGGGGRLAGSFSAEVCP